MKKFDIEKYKNLKKMDDGYIKQLARIKKKGFETACVEKTITSVMEKLRRGINSFVIYGDPQSGKTGMMIALTAKLLDFGKNIIIILINDNVGLLEQNLRRFSESGLDPDPKNYKEILDDVYSIKESKRILFCKKNSSDLKQLIRKLGDCKEKVIIDDEADYASPNGKVNKDEKTKINELIGELIDEKSIYIGVTATPARLDLNNTFDNCNNEWVYFPSHSKYIGQDHFFPVNLNVKKLPFKLEFLPEQHDAPKFLREALFRFLINVAYINLENKKNGKEESFYTMLIHTSGKTDDHIKDHNDIVSILEILRDETKFERHVQNIFETAEKMYGEEYAEQITKYILINKDRNSPLVINSKKDKENLEKAAKPKALFTIAIGGNIISRGVTFENLLSMYFTRTVKTKLQQDTYIQRARMFGSRSSYLNFFELTIPDNLYTDWHRSFVFHRLALDSAKNGNPPVWLEDSRIKSVAPGSVDKSTVITDSGEMSYGIFRLTEDIESIVNNEGEKSFDKIDNLHKILGEERLPQHLINFIRAFSPDGNNSLAIHAKSDISGWGEDVNKENISRPKGFMATSGALEKNKYPHAIHHIKIYYNQNNKKARVFYKFIGITGTKFLRNIKSI